MGLKSRRELVCLIVWIEISNANNFFLKIPVSSFYTFQMVWRISLFYLNLKAWSCRMEKTIFICFRKTFSRGVRFLKLFFISCLMPHLMFMHFYRFNHSFEAYYFESLTYLLRILKLEEVILILLYWNLYFCFKLHLRFTFSNFYSRTLKWRES